MNLTITPNSLKEYSERNAPPTITVGPNIIAFNNKAKNTLALKENDRFLLEFDSGDLFYKESKNDSGFCLRPIGKYGILSASAHQIIPFLHSILNDKLKSYKFKIGEFKEGRRLLFIIK